MASGEILIIARNIKEEGNGFYKRGILPEAQKSYTKMLDMLREEITFTGDDQKKERQSLILAAHLNLAQCALRLGDDVKVIDHCNIALGLDSNNVKAYFRRAKAYENLSEYSRALEGYQTVLRLEPNNSAAQKQQSECQKKFDSERTVKEMYSLTTRQKSNNTDDNDMEIVYENCEDAPNSRYKNCTKNPGHEMFISVKDFQINHLPPGYQDQDLFEHLGDQISVTVLLKVRGSSEHRPEYFPGTHDRYPASGKKYRKSIRYGSGWLHCVGVKNEEGACPCAACHTSGSPFKQWAEIRIKTARHVVYDDIEGKKTICYFFYDSDRDDLRSCLSLCNPVKVEGTEMDVSFLIFASHDQGLIAQLNKMWQKYATSLLKVKQKYSRDVASGDQTNRHNELVQLSQRLDELTTQLHQQADKILPILNGDPATEYVKHLAKGKGEESDETDMLGDLLLDKLNGGEEYKRHIRYISNDIKISGSFLASIGEVVKSYQGMVSTEQGEQLLKTLHPQYQNVITVLEKRVSQSQYLLPPEERRVNTRSSNTEEYNKAHSLTVIVSHPHGCSKKISMGEVTDNANPVPGFFCQYTYSTATCPGSSGALVFILGDKLCYYGHPHSRSESTAHAVGGQRNENALGRDL